MATILKNIVQFTGLVVGVPTPLPHGLNINGNPIAPQLGGADASGFTVTADTVNVTVTRTASASSGDVNVFVEYWHSIEAVLPPGKLIGLIPFFFAGGGGGGGGGVTFPVTPTLTGSAALTVNKTNIYTSSNAEPFTGTLPFAASVPNGTLLVLKNVNEDGFNIGAPTLLPSGTDLVDGFSSYNLQEFLGGNSLILVSDGVSNWWFIAQFTLAEF